MSTTALSYDTINQIAQRSAEGINQVHTSKELGIAQSTVSSYLKKPEVKELSDTLRDQLRKKHSTRFIARKIIEEKAASTLSDYMLGRSKDNTTLYKSVEDIEKYLTRQDRFGTRTLDVTGINLPHAAFQINNQYNQGIHASVISENVLKLFQASNGAEMPASDAVEVASGEVVV